MAGMIGVETLKILATATNSTCPLPAVNPNKGRWRGEAHNIK